MSSENFISYFGLRFEIQPHEIEALELRLDPRMMAARKVGLKCYWGNFGGMKDEYLLFIGKELAILGIEGAAEVSITPDDFQRIMIDVEEKLEDCGFMDKPALHLRWQPDI